MFKYRVVLIRARNDSTFWKNKIFQSWFNFCQLYIVSFSTYVYYWSCLFLKLYHSPLINFRSKWTWQALRTVNLSNFSARWQPTIDTMHCGMASSNGHHICANMLQLPPNMETFKTSCGFCLNFTAAKKYTRQILTIAVEFKVTVLVHSFPQRSVPVIALVLWFPWFVDSHCEPIYQYIAQLLCCRADTSGNAFINIDQMISI